MSATTSLSISLSSTSIASVSRRDVSESLPPLMPKVSAEIGEVETILVLTTSTLSDVWRENWLRTSSTGLAKTTSSGAAFNALTYLTAFSWIIKLGSSLHKDGRISSSASKGPLTTCKASSIGNDRVVSAFSLIKSFSYAISSKGASVIRAKEKASPKVVGVDLNSTHCNGCLTPEI
nr:hypothetical protein [Tanacetum cinerariifolium]